MTRLADFGRVYDDVDGAVDSQEEMIEPCEEVNPFRPELDGPVGVHLTDLLQSQSLSPSSQNLRGLVDVAHDPDRVAEDEDHHDGDEED